jgi:hypothetical protein
LGTYTIYASDDPVILQYVVVLSFFYSVLQGKKQEGSHAIMTENYIAAIVEEQWEEEYVPAY